MAARSFLITVENSVRRLWKRTDLGLKHGVWSNGGALVPPEQIDPSTVDADGDSVPSRVQFGSESSGFATGTEGWVQYESPPTGTQPLATLRIEWVNPYIGSNRFYVTVPSPPYTASPDAIGGKNAVTTVVVRKA